MKTFYKIKHKILNRIRGTYKYGIKYLYSEKFRKNIKNRNQRRRRKKAVGTRFINKTRRIKANIAKWKGSRCNLCKNNFDLKELSIDHIVCAKDGGGGWYDNLQLLCLGCHRIKDGNVKKLLVNKEE